MWLLYLIKKYLTFVHQDHLIKFPEVASVLERYVMKYRLKFRISNHLKEHSY
jgi:3'-phosphoadenosine 5'-phosphosulfate sulfotransferase (PAPS reductase)/FAD synthetase